MYCLMKRCPIFRWQGGRVQLWGRGARLFVFLFNGMWQFRVSSERVTNETCQLLGTRWRAQEVATPLNIYIYQIDITSISSTLSTQVITWFIRLCSYIWCMYLWCFISQLKLFPRWMFSRIYDINGKRVNQHQIDIVDIVPVILYLLIWWICFLSV